MADQQRAAGLPAAGGPHGDEAEQSGVAIGDPTAEIERLRGRLLGGRGPGASERERTVFMHNRPTLGALPTMVERELVQVHTDLARGDAAAIDGELARVRLQLAETLDQLVARLSPAGLAASARWLVRVRVERILGLPVGQSPAELGPVAEAVSTPPRAATAGPPLDGDGPAWTAPAGRPWWWQVAIRSAALGAAGTLAVVLLLGWRRPGRSVRDPCRPAGPASLPESRHRPW